MKKLSRILVCGGICLALLFSPGSDLSRKAFVRGDYENEQFGAVNAELSDASTETFRNAVLNLPVFQLSMYVAAISILWIGGRNSTLPSATSRTAASAAGAWMSDCSSITREMRSTLASARVSSKNTLEIIMSEFMISST